MVIVTLNMPDEFYNRVNNYYDTNFGYDIYTQLYTFLFHELEKCEDYPTTKPPAKPKPSIRCSGHKNSDYMLVVTYPDKTTLQVSDTFENLSKILKEWSKYSFSKDKKEDVLSKFDKSKVSNINKSYNKWEVRKNINKTKYHFGYYDSIDKAINVKRFLESRNWDLKYLDERELLEKVAEGRDEI